MTILFTWMGTPEDTGFIQLRSDIFAVIYVFETIKIFKILCFADEQSDEVLISPVYATTQFQTWLLVGI